MGVMMLDNMGPFAPSNVSNRYSRLTLHESFCQLYRRQIMIQQCRCESAARKVKRAIQRAVSVRERVGSRSCIVDVQRRARIH